MSARPGIEQLRWETYMPFGEGFVISSLIVVILIVVFSIAFIERSKDPKIIRLRNKILVLSCAVGLVLFVTNILLVEKNLKEISETNEEKFFTSELNQEWYEENYDKMKQQMQTEKYSVNNVLSIRKIDEETREIKERVYSSKGLGSVWGWDTIRGKEKIVWEDFQKEKDADIFFVQMRIKNENGEIKEVKAFTTVSTGDSEKDEAEITQTSSYSGDIGDNILFGELRFKENVFKDE